MKEKEALKRLLSSNIDFGENETVLLNLKEKLSSNGKIELFIDGASNLQNKTAGLGGVFYQNGMELYSFAEFRPDLTNNEAEYGALIFGLEKALELSLNSIDIFSDSELVVRQITGVYKVKNPRMALLYKEVIRLLDRLDQWSITHVRREKNTRADELSKEGINASK
tara:strand:+ start:247 stop:747 length:501 start_codon:yes stop_codon:yes gene_type:complete